MNTTFVIMKYSDPELNDDGSLHPDKINRYEYAEVAFRSSALSTPSEDIKILLSYIPDHVRVYPIDNSPQGIFTVGDIKKQILEQKQHVRNF